MLAPVKRIGLVDQLVTSGDITCAVNAAITVIPGLELDLPAVVGDRVCCGISGMRSASDQIDIGAIVGSTVARWMSTLSNTSASDGLLAWYSSSAGFFNFTFPRFFTVTANDLDGANVRWVLGSKGGGTSVIKASTTDTYYWAALNIGPP